MDYYDHLNNNARATEYGDALIFEKEVINKCIHACMIYIIYKYINI